MMKLFTIIFTLTCLSVFGQENGLVSKLTIDSLPQVQGFMGTGVDTFHYFSVPDTNMLLYSLPDKFHKSKKWIGAEKSRLDYEFYGGRYSDTFDLADALAAIDTAKNLSAVCAAKSWCLKNYRQSFPFLVKRLSVKTKVGLSNTADLIIWERVGSGDLKFYGHGGGMQEDIFTIAGRASWVLNELTGENFAVVHGNMTEQQSQEFKRLWLQYIRKLKNN